MRLRNTLVLLVVAAALVVFVFVFEARSPSTDEMLEAERLAFPDFEENKDRADAIELARGDAKTVFVKRDVGTSNERWHMTQPIDYRADSSRIVGLLGALERAEKSRVEGDERSISIVPTANLTQYGLDQDSAARIRVAAGDEVLVDAFVGCKIAGGDRVYVRPAGLDEVYVVGGDVRENALRPINEFRDKRLLDLRAGQVTRCVVFEDEKPVYELARERDGPWRMVSPVTDRADETLADGIADKMGSLWADVFHTDFVADDPEMPKKLSELGLRPARRSVKVTLDVGGNIRQHEVLFGKKLKKKEGAETSWNVYATVVGTRTVVHLPDDVIGKIDVKVDDLRSRKVFDFDAGEARTLTVDRPAGPLRIEKTGDEWMLAKPEEHEADPKRVEELLDELAGLRIREFLPFDTAQPGLIRVEVGLAAGEDESEDEPQKRRSEVVFFENRKAGSVIARRGEAGAVFEIPGAVVEKLVDLPYRFWDRTMLTFNHLDIRKITVASGERTETAVGELVKDEDGKERISWQLAGGGEVDTDVADRIKWDFSGLEAEELLGPVDDAKLGDYGLDAPATRVELAVKATERDGGGERTCGLRVGSPGEAGTTPGVRRFYAKFDDDPMLFLLREAVVKNVRKGLAKAREADEAEPRGAPQPDAVENGAAE
jgi:hypothetical protein